ncbi:hypothetical protein WJX72_002431 [[Myrmecia] bisecta]|uniref:Uncharacterized protein n=1 Tax=[Myrmecia] bisecta TaxID=41462 RepID=A0AAW1PSW2_9CHLO
MIPRTLSRQLESRRTHISTCTANLTFAKSLALCPRHNLVRSSTLRCSRLKRNLSARAGSLGELCSQQDQDSDSDAGVDVEEKQPWSLDDAGKEDDNDDDSDDDSDENDVNLCKRHLQLNQESLGAEHWATLSSMNSLANALQESMEHDGAMDMSGEVLAIRREVRRRELGTEDRWT